MSDLKQPTRQAERIDFLDILRGIAVLAIFVVNIKAMFQPFAFYSNASLWSGPYDMTVAALQAFAIEDKWRTVFTMLFGVGLALIAERARARGAGELGLLARRLSWLLVFGLFHLFFIWVGDILTTYAVCGFLVLWYRHASAKRLFFSAFGLLAVAYVWTGAFAYWPAQIPELRADLEPILWGTDPAVLEEQTAAMLGGVGAHLEARLGEGGEYILFYFLMGGHWLETLAIMLAGMWAYRVGFFRADFPARGYAAVAGVGLGGAFLVDTARWRALTGSDWDFGAWSMLQPLNQADGYLGAAGYAALVGLLVKLGWRPGALAAVGKMAFTNYIACSLIGTTLAYGHAGGLFGSLSNLQLMGVFAATALAMLIWSPLWLARFRFGPLEWLWRSLTYRRAQPLLR